MPTFPASELQRNPAEIQKAALMAPVFLTYHDKPRYVMMSLEEFARIQRMDVGADLSTYPQAIASRIRQLAEANLEPGGELPSAVDKLVLRTINAPYKRSIDAETLRTSLAKFDLDHWLVHIATFFTDVAPDLVLKFADQHGISRSKLAKAYLAVKRRTGERNRALEADLVPMASSSRPNDRRAGRISKKGKSHP